MANKGCSDAFTDMSKNESNKDLIIRLREGDILAFDALYARYCRRIYGFVLRYIKQSTDAEGIVQEVFIKIWETRSKIRVNSSFESFLFTIAYNTTISLLRKRVNENKYLDHLKSIQWVEKTPDLMDEIYFRELDENLQLYIDKLSPRQKEIYQLSREEGLTYVEIASKLNISVNTVRNHMVAALSFLKTNIYSRMMLGILMFALFL
jgi:RNA polymerase sigma-19 factor, ECF subfamily